MAAILYGFGSPIRLTGDIKRKRSTAKHKHYHSPCYFNVFRKGRNVKAKQKLWRCIWLLRTLLYHHCTTTTLKNLINITVYGRRKQQDYKKTNLGHQVTHFWQQIINSDMILYVIYTRTKGIYAHFFNFLQTVEGWSICWGLRPIVTKIE